MADTDYTNYRLLNIPSDVDILVDGAPALENTWYANTLSLVASKKNADDYGEPFATIQYQTTDGTVLSDIVNLSINFKVDTGTPASGNKTTVILNDVTTNLKAELPVNDSTDRIKIISFGEAGQLFLGNSLVYQGQIILRKDFLELDFISDEFGFGDPYNSIVYLTGNKDGFDVTEYTLELEIVGQASLVLLNSEKENVNGVSFYNLKITNGIPEGIANLDFIVAFDGGQTASFMESSLLTGEFVNGTENLDTPLGATTGELYFNISITVAQADRPEAGTITITLNNIDGDSGNVDGASNTIILNTNGKDVLTEAFVEAFI